jgi:predicted  nucleic acid-binding Zn-ribbon protein
VNVQEDETPGGLPPHDPDRDVLAERRARRGEPVGDPILIRRAETAEAAAQALEDRLGGIQARLREAERESETAAQLLAEREQELTRASARLSDGEQQLHLISTRLQESERELRSVSERLSERERELQAVSERLAEREQQLHRAELEIRGRVEALERRVGEVQEELVRERSARQAAEGELQALRAAQAAVAPLIGDLRQIAHRLRGVAEAQPPVPEPMPPSTIQEPAAPLAAGAPTSPAQSAAGGLQADPGSAQMAEALAAAVQRLRARVASVGDLQESQPFEAAGPAQPEVLAPVGDEPQGLPAEAAPDTVPYTPPPVLERTQPRAWLAPAIRRVAERRDPRLAAELVLELLPAQALSIDKPLRYLVKIVELGAYEVSLAGGHGSVRDLAGAGLIDSRTFLLEGPAAAFAEVAAGGGRLSAWRPPPGLRIRGGRRRARRLLSSRGAPVALSELEAAGVTVWPGLLLLALAEAIDPASTTGHSFTIAFAIEGHQSAVLQVQALQGRPLAVTRGPVEAGGEGDQSSLEASPQTTVRLSERGFAALLTGRDLAGETVLLEGELAPLQTLLSWTDRIQGIRRFGA